MADWYQPNLVIPKLAPRTVEQSEVRYQNGDDPRWASPDWDDSSWPVIERSHVPLQAGIFWLRVRVRTAAPGERLPSLVIIGVAAPHDLFWDGERINSAGRPANRPEDELPGNNRVNVELSATATAPGEHVVAFRMSTYRRARVGARFSPLFLWTVRADEYDAVDRKLNMLCAMGVGALFTLGIAVFVMWLLDVHRLILALLAALCLAAAGLVAVAAAPSMWLYSASLIYWQSLARVVLSVVVAGLLVAAVSQQFHAARRRWLWVPMAVEALAAWWLISRGSSTSMILWRMALAAGLLLALEALWRRREGAPWVFAGVVVAIFIFEGDPTHFEHTRLLMGLLPLIVGLIAAMATTVGRERRAAHETKLMAARLEIELLRKNLQPHFLLNTLTALAQVIEEKPAAAVRLIDDLAAEFRSLNRLSTEKQVRLADEVALCRAHLRVMSARTERTWSLETDGVDLNAAVPPAIFLTLIENGFSHQRVETADTAFRLSADRAGNRVRYTFLSPGEIVAKAPRNGGTGLAYVRSRLDESFHGAWTLSQRAAASGWETVIELGPAGADAAPR